MNISSMIFPDEYIEKWAGIYLVNPLLRKRGILFESFVKFPEAILKVVFMTPPLPPVDTYGHEPLLLAQFKIAQQTASDELDEDDEIGWSNITQTATKIATSGPSVIQVRNGTMIEPLHHSAWPRRRGAAG